jgi:hypothetical protein
MDVTHEVFDTDRMVNSWSDASADGSDAWGAVTTADYDGDGRPEFTVGGRCTRGRGFLRLYDYLPDVAEGTWTRRTVTDTFRPGVGAAAADWDGDGRPEVVCGAWDREGLLHVVAAPDRDGFGEVREAAGGIDNPHDVLAADVDGDGRPEVLAREKDGALLAYDVPDDPAGEWTTTTIASELIGDGTAVTSLVDGTSPQVVTNRGWFERTDGGWERHPLVPEELAWDDETRVAVGDLDGDGDAEVVISESELEANARLAVLSRPDGGPRSGAWDVEILVDAEEDRRAMHSLQVADLDGDGALEIFAAEMENGKTDGVDRTPKWWAFSHDGDWHRETLLDVNLGTHEARVADVDGDGRPDIVGKTWRGNEINAVEGLDHADRVDPG